MPSVIPFPKPENPKFTFIDLFAGMGAFRQAFQEAGGECVFSCENDKFAVKTYEANYGDTPHGDITEIDKKTIPDHNILCGGFPCQPFSPFGKQLGFKDTRGTIFYEIADVLATKQPEMFILENVPNLLHHDSQKTFKAIYHILSEELDYFCSYKILNSNPYVPQNRRRLFIIGHKLPTLPFYFDQIIAPERHPKLDSILEDKVDKRYNISDKRWAGMLKHKKRHQLKSQGWGYNIFYRHEVACTLVANYYKDGQYILIDQGEENPRRLTPRECARLMGFPEELKIVVSRTQIYKQLGNSIVVPQLTAIAKVMVKYLLEEEDVIEMPDMLELSPQMALRLAERRRKHQMRKALTRNA